MPGRLFCSGIFFAVCCSFKNRTDCSFWARKTPTAQLVRTVEPKSIKGVLAMRSKNSLISVEILTHVNREGFTFKVKAAVPITITAVHLMPPKFREISSSISLPVSRLLHRTLKAETSTTEEL